MLEVEALSGGTGEDVTVTMVETRLGNRIALFHFRCAGAKYTVIHSHGNATDCGVMQERYRELMFELGANVIGYEYFWFGSIPSVCEPTDSSGCSRTPGGRKWRILLGAA